MSQIEMSLFFIAKCYIDSLELQSTAYLR